MSTFVKISDTWIETDSIESINAHVKPNYHASELHTVKIITKSGQVHGTDMYESEVISLLENLTGTNRWPNTRSSSSTGRAARCSERCPSRKPLTAGL